MIKRILFCSMLAALCARSDISPALTDLSGRDVEIPEKVERVVSPFMMYTRIVAALGAADKLVGISHTCVLPEEERPYGVDLLELPDVGNFGSNIELIAALDPDIIFSLPQSVHVFEEKTGATVISASFPAGKRMEQFFAEQIDVIGAALHKEKEASELKAYIREKTGKVTAVTSGIPEEERPRVYFAWTSWTGDITNTVVDFDPIELAGGINVAGDCGNFARGQRGILVSREHIIKWNPDIIFLSRYSSGKWEKASAGDKKAPVTIEEVLSDPLLRDVDAVRNGRVYYTTAFCNWWPHQRAIAQIFQMAKIFHPQKFEKLDVVKEGDEVFKRFYGEDGLYSRLVSDLELYTGGGE
ncbi:MAG: ABC transporter substrate-binding protein [Candidatus Omnitrophica bacterium]|nr:ABC transporter substrate-binding protein [Candidatus Omnitrophota bacterium]